MSHSEYVIFPEEVPTQEETPVDVPDFAVISEKMSNNKRAISDKRETIKRLKTDVKDKKTTIQDEEDAISILQDEVIQQNADVVSYLSGNLESFQSSIGDLKKLIIDGFKKVDEKFVKFDERFENLEDKVEKFEKKMDRSIIVLNNKRTIEKGERIEELPFTVDSKPSTLPTLTHLGDIKKLTMRQVKRFLVGYGEPITGSEVELRIKLAQLHGATEEWFHIITG